MLIPGVPENETERIQALIELGILDSHAEERFDRLTNLALIHFNAKNCLVSLVDVDRQWFKSKVGLDICETKRDISFCGHAILYDEIMVVPDAREDDRFSDNPMVIGEPSIVFYAGAPLSTTGGHRVGTLCLFDDKPRILDPQQLSTLRELADMVERELNDLSHKQLQRERHESILRTHRMLDVFPDMVFIIDHDLRFIASNDHPDLYLPREQFIGQTVAEVLPEDIAMLFEEAIGRVFKSGELVKFNYQLRLRGELNFFEARAKSISDSEILVVVRNTTEEQARMIELERLSMVAEQTTNGVVITDLDKKVLWINKAFTTISGYSLEEMLTQNPGAKLQGLETNPETIEKMRIALKQEQSYTVDVINYHKNGHPYWVHIVCNPWLNKYGEVQGFIAIQSDVTQQIKNVEEIQHNQRLLSAVIDANSIGTWCLNLQTRRLEINENWANLLGYSLHELEPVDMDTWQDLTHPHDLEKCLKMFKDYDEGLIDYYESPIRMKHKKGHWVWIRTTGSITSRTDDGKAEFSLGTHLDINAQMLAEAHLQEQYDYMQLLFDSMIDGIVIFDAEDKIQSLNPSSELIFGYTRQEILNQNIDKLIPAIHANQLDGELQYSEGKRKGGDVFPMEIGIVESKHEQEKIYVCMLRDITERENAEKAIHNLAYFDGLSGLPNRRLLFDRLQQALLKSVRSKNHVAILFVDFDNFKQINDSAGHEVGDMLLQQIAERLKFSVRVTDTVARLGGDEFVVIREGLNCGRDKALVEAETIARSIKAELSEPYKLGNSSYTGSCCIGITLCDNPSLSCDEFLKQADLAMYQSKLAGKNAIRFFAAEMQERVNNRIEIEQDLRSALAKQEFEVFYQAQVNHEGCCIGAEALLRWRHPRKGLVSPMAFIPIAEESGLIVPIGQCVLKQACMCLADWADNHTMSDFFLAVNVSVVELRQDDWVESVLSIIDATGANPFKLKLEVTESVMAFDIEMVTAKLSKLREHGIGISLDDFGTGYSSLTYLQNLPLDQLKLDKSFVRDILIDPNDKAIAETIINLAKMMDLSVIAEGVETEQQLMMLKDLGCQEFQGYFFGKPVPLELFEGTFFLKADT